MKNQIFKKVLKLILAVAFAALFFLLIYCGFWGYFSYQLMKANHETELKVIEKIGDNVVR